MNRGPVFYLYWLTFPWCRIHASVNLVSNGSDSGLSPILAFWLMLSVLNTTLNKVYLILSYLVIGLLSIRPLGTNFKIWIETQNFSFAKIHSKTSSVKWRPFCPGGDELINCCVDLSYYLVHLLGLDCDIADKQVFYTKYFKSHPFIILSICHTQQTHTHSKYTCTDTCLRIQSHPNCKVTLPPQLICAKFPKVVLC